MNVTNPYTNEVIAEMEPTPCEHLATMVAHSRAAQLLWQEASYSERQKVVVRFGQLLTKQAEYLARRQAIETGKPICQARSELAACSARIDYFLNECQRHLQSEICYRGPGLVEELRSEPLGCLLNISAWNYPYFVSLNVQLPALLTGNSLIYKPSEFASMIGADLDQLWQQAGLPVNVFQLVQGGPQSGQALLDLDPGFDGIFFTGSYSTGQQIISSQAPRMTPLVLELGGKDPVYVADDVAVAMAAASLVDGCFYNAGQSCCGVERIYVHKKVYRSFVDEMVNLTKRLKWGDPLEDETYLGPLTRRSQLEFLQSQLEDAKSKGAKVVCGGQPVDHPAAFFAPTILVDVDHTMAVMREESFGPMIGIMEVDSDEEAYRLMSDTPYGLTAGVYSRDQGRAEAILKRIKAGTVYWNCCDRVSPHLPWSGRGRSGIGATLGSWGIRSFLAPKSWHWRLP